MCWECDILVETKCFIDIGEGCGIQAIFITSWKSTTIILLYSDRRFDVKMVKSSIQFLVILFLAKYGGWYMPVTVKCLFLAVTLQVAYSKDFVDPFCRDCLVMGLPYKS